MKINNDCIRDLLLYLEENLDYNKEINLNNINLGNYSQNDLLYTAEKLSEANFLNTVIKWNTTSTHIIVVKSITYNGHEFLDTIRDETVWKETKSILSKVSSSSISFISNIAIQVLSNIISKQMGLS